VIPRTSLLWCFLESVEKFKALCLRPYGPAGFRVPVSSFHRHFVGVGAAHRGEPCKMQGQSGSYDAGTVLRQSDRPFLRRLYGWIGSIYPEGRVMNQLITGVHHLLQGGKYGRTRIPFGNIALMNRCWWGMHRPIPFIFILYLGASICQALVYIWDSFGSGPNCVGVLIAPFIFQLIAYEYIYIYQSSGPFMPASVVVCDNSTLHVRIECRCTLFYVYIYIHRYGAPLIEYVLLNMLLELQSCRILSWNVGWVCHCCKRPRRSNGPWQRHFYGSSNCKLRVIVSSVSHQFLLVSGLLQLIVNDSHKEGTLVMLPYFYPIYPSCSWRVGVPVAWCFMTPWYHSARFNGPSPFF